MKRLAVLFALMVSFLITARAADTFKSTVYQGQSKDDWTRYTFSVPANSLFSLLTFIDEYRDQPSYLEVSIHGMDLTVAKASGPYSSNNVKGVAGEGVAFTGPAAEALRIEGPAMMTVYVYGRSRCLITYGLSQ